MKKIVTIVIILTSLLFPLSGYAQKSKAKGKGTTAPAVNPEALLADARKAVAEYRFDEAARLIGSYRNALKGATPSAEAEQIEHTATLGEEMLERVQDLVIIDSVTVDKAKFFEAYKLSPQAGTLRMGSEDINSPIYVTQSGLNEFFAAPDETDDTYGLVSARVLADGTLESPRRYDTPEGLDDVAYPFLMPDGLTLYFAATGEQSLGGYDIFITRRSGVDDDFLAPQNMGMPFNSPYDDYLLAIDEATGIGWWATDRQQIPGKVTVYMFVPSELRTNLDPDTSVDIPSRAFIHSIVHSQPAGFVKPDIDALVRVASSSAVAPEFQFALPGGRIVTSLSELSSGRARELMADWLDTSARLEAMRSRLATLRGEYAAGTLTAATEILDLESRVEQTAAELQRIANEVVKAEK